MHPSQQKIVRHRDNIYLNAVIDANPDVYPSNTVAVYDEQFNQPFIQNPSLYYASIIRFDIPLETIPILKFPLDNSPGQMLPNLSALTVGIELGAVNAGGARFLRPILYIPTNNIPPPSYFPPAYSNSQSISAYYSIYSITAFLEMYNSALALAVTDSGLGVTAPYFTYNQATELISLVMTQAFLNSGAGVIVNRLAINYVSAFPVFFYENSRSQGFIFRILLYPTQLLTVSAGIFSLPQDYIAMALWFDLRKIYVTTDLPINPENVPQQSDNGQNSGVLSFQPIITDFVVNFDNTNAVQTVLVYNPSPAYRLVDMTSNTPLSKLKLQFFYLDKNGNSFPIRISPNNQISIKIGFFKKALYSNDWQIDSGGKYVHDY